MMIRPCRLQTRIFSWKCSPVQCMCLRQALTLLPLSYVKAVVLGQPRYWVLRRFLLYSLTSVSPDSAVFQKLFSCNHFYVRYGAEQNYPCRLLRRNLHLRPHRSSRASRNLDARFVGGTFEYELWRLLRRSQNHYRPRLFRSRSPP